MITGIIKYLKTKRCDLETEEFYINNIVSLQKDCWRMNMNQSKIFKETCKYLNKINLSQERHPFLIEFKTNINKLKDNPILDKDKVNEIFSSLYRRRDELRGHSINK